MPSSRKSNDLGVPDAPTPKTPEEMETRLIGLAYKRTEKQILDGSVSPTTLNYFLRLGGTRAELELEKVKNENKLLEAKTTSLESHESMQELFASAMKMFGVYSGQDPMGDEEFDEWEEED